jgi:magnesium chelatase family protein
MFKKRTVCDIVMSLKVYSAAVVGVDAFEVEIEVRAGCGPEGRISVVGLPDTAVKESRDRVLSALSNSALRRPRGKITINIAPATVRKAGPSFDLPIALAMLQLNGQNRIPDLDHCYICGELALSGELRPVKGTLAVALEARKRCRERLIAPQQNAAEAAVADGLSVIGVTSLSEVVQFLRGEKELAVVPAQPWTAHKIRDESDFSEVKDQYHVRRAVEVRARTPIKCTRGDVESATGRASFTPSRRGHDEHERFAMHRDYLESCVRTDGKAQKGLR